MKRILILLLFFAALSASAQTDTTEVQTDSVEVQMISLPDSTAIGIPDGKLVSKEIGSSGGTIVSEDGRVELNFPEGALSTNTTINIQPATNLAPNGAGKSYQFKPSGIQFEKPVQLVLHYTDEEAESCPPELMSLAMQDHKGKWSLINYEHWDSSGKTLTGYIHHFSYASNVFLIRLKPEKRKLLVQETIRINIMEFHPGFGKSFEAFFAPRQKTDWFVNDISMGNDLVGTLTVYETVEKATRRKESFARYKAPDYILEKGNPVTVSFDVKILSGPKKGQTRTVSCKIEIYDVYRITVDYTVDVMVAPGNEVSDSANFLVWVYPKDVAIDNIQNYPPYISKSTRHGFCNMIIFTERRQGPVHMIDNHVFDKLSKDKPPEVFFHFLKTFESNWFQYQWICKHVKPGSKEEAQGAPLAPEINFIANRQTQRIDYNFNGIKYKLIVVPFTPK